MDHTPQPPAFQSQTRTGPVSVEDDLVNKATWLRLLFRVIKDAIHRELTALEFKIFLVLVLESYRFGTRAIWLHEDKILPAMTGIQSQNIGRPIKSLQAYGMIKRRRVDDGFEYRVVPSSRRWGAPICRNVPNVEESFKFVRRVVGQLHLDFERRELDQMLEQLSFDEAWSESQDSGGVSLAQVENLKGTEGIPKRTASLSLSERGAVAIERDRSLAQLENSHAGSPAQVEKSGGAEHDDSWPAGIAALRKAAENRAEAELECH